MNPAPVSRPGSVLAALVFLAGVWLCPAHAAAVTEGTDGVMTTGQAVLLGIVEGLTEYLPVSSTGHLLLTQRLLGIGNTPDTKTAADAYAICIQAGAILAVLGLYFRRVRGIAAGLLGRDPAGLRLGLNVLIAFLPAVVAGLTLEKSIKAGLFGGGQWGLWPIVGALFVGGLVILLVDRWMIAHRADARGCALEALTWRMAAMIGLVQCLAMWPGVSRSLATIVGGMLVGLTVPAAVEFSFLLGLVTLTASTLRDAVGNGQDMLALYGWFKPLLGMAVAALAAAGAVKWMVTYLNRHSMAIFGYYRILLAAGVAAVLLSTATR